MRNTMIKTGNKKLTPDELAEQNNNYMFNNQEYYISFIELPKANEKKEKNILI